MIPIIHRSCGGQLAWWLGNDPGDDDLIIADTMMYLDGSQPKSGDRFYFGRPKCDGVVDSPSQIVRVAPGCMTTCSDGAVVEGARSYARMLKEEAGVDVSTVRVIYRDKGETVVTQVDLDE